jgi:hypothetical protein
VPSRQIDFDAIWTSNKLASCKEENRVEYVWFYGLADANGCFEINIPAIHSKLSVIRPKLYVPRILRILADFHDHGLLFLWITTEQYGFWTGSEVKGRLPPVSLRSRYRTHCPPVPRKELREYESRHSLERVRIMSRQGLGLGFSYSKEGGQQLEKLEAHPSTALEQRKNGRKKHGENHTKSNAENGAESSAAAEPEFGAEFTPGEPESFIAPPNGEFVCGVPETGNGADDRGVLERLVGPERARSLARFPGSHETVQVPAHPGRNPRSPKRGT